MPVADGAGHAAVHEEVHEGRSDELHHALLLGEVDVLAGSGALSVVDAEQRREGADHAAERVSEGVLHRDGMLAVISRRALEARDGAETHAVGPNVAHRSEEPGGGHRDHDHIGLHGAERLVAKAQLVHDAGAEVLEHDVAVGDHLPGQCLPSGFFRSTVMLPLPDQPAWFCRLQSGSRSRPVAKGGIVRLMSTRTRDSIL